MEADTGSELEQARAFELWRDAFRDTDGRPNPEYSQVLTPYRGEPFGVDALNLQLQRHAQGRMVDRIGTLDGITLFDKVIQFRNRGASNPLWAYNANSRENQPVEVFNGELGFVKPHGFDGGRWKSGKHFNLTRIQVEFSRKPGLWVGYGSKLGRKPEGKYISGQPVEDNLELAYAISVHKSQGSEFERVYFVVPKHKQSLLSREFFYTGLTRAYRHCTLLIQEDISPLIRMRRPEASHLQSINASLFEFSPVAEELLEMHEWYEEGKIHRALTDIMVRSKSEVIIANMLHSKGIPFRYEVPLYAGDGTFYLPDFTLNWRGEEWYWEHLGMLHDSDYKAHWETKRRWYEKHGFSSNLIISEEQEGFDAPQVEHILEAKLGL